MGALVSNWNKDVFSATQVFLFPGNLKMDSNSRPVACVHKMPEWMTEDVYDRLLSAATK